MTALERQRRTDAADALCSAAFVRAVEKHPPGDAPERGPGGSPEPAGVALVAVGGYGRSELAPHSDLDVVLVHTDDVEVGEVATEVWYPLWDAGVDLDHSVRALSEVTETARGDVRVALGLLDARHLAGDPSVTLRMRSTLLAQWRREARARIPDLRVLVDKRVERAGELAHASLPDLKESGGGLRDATVLNALVATWLVDVPHADLERSRMALLDVRDALHVVAGRATDRVPPDMWDDLAATLGLGDATAAQRHVRELGRRITHLSRLTWRRLEAALAPRATRSARRAGPAMVPLGHGLAVASGEVVLTRDAEVGSSPSLLLRAAAEAAERDLVLAPPTVARLVREAPDLPDPWPQEARDLLVRLLAAGPALLPVWETLDETDAIARFLPEWERVRLLPHASSVHRFTVDRHQVETCIEASRLIRRVSRPDLLLLAALVHDIGKGGRQDHSVAGAPVAAALARRMGLPDPDVDVVATLVRRHLLLADVATTRDLEDPHTATQVVEAVGGGRETLELLAVLTEADARATSSHAWTRWRASLVRELVERVAGVISDGPSDEPEADQPAVEVPPGVRGGSGAVDVHVAGNDDGSVVTVVAEDRTGLLAAVAGVLAMSRASVRSARAWTRDGYAFSRWHVDATALDPAVVRERLLAVLDGRLTPADRLGAPVSTSMSPSVAVRPEASRQATVLEVRVADRPGVLFLVCQALAEIGVAVRSAHIDTLGPQAVDVLYLQEESAGALVDSRAAEAAHAVRRALTDPVTLGA